MNRVHAACGFVHDTPVEKLACETVHILHHETGGSAAIVIVKRRPSDCERCAANFDALMAARAAIQPLKGSC